MPRNIAVEILLLMFLHLSIMRCATEVGTRVVECRADVKPHIFLIYTLDADEWSVAQSNLESVCNPSGSNG
jgi:hypothetical protein